MECFPRYARADYAAPAGYYDTYYNNVVSHLQSKSGVLSATEAIQNILV